MFGKSHKIERRLRPRRLLVNPPIYVSVDQSSAALLFDLGEGGLSVYGLVPKKRDEIFPVAFDLPVGGGSIQASAGIAWTSTAKNRTGIRFVDFADASRQRLVDWMGARTYTARPTAFESTPADPIPLSQSMGSYLTSVSQEQKDGLAGRLESLSILPPSIRGFESSKLEQTDVETPSRAGKLRLVIELLVTVALLFLALGFLRSYRSKIAQTGKAREVTVTLPAAHSTGSSAPANALSAAAPSRPAASALDVPGFMLQVGAMRIEGNADGLSNSLKRKGFPVFVFKRSADRFYRVAVGPYADMSSAKRVADELQRENVEAILKPWMPE